MKKFTFWIIGFFGISIFLATLLPSASGVQGIQTTSASPTPTPTYIYEPPVQPACSGSALCRDGSCHYSTNKQNACFRHGGVARWL